MIINYLLTAWRNLAKNKLNAVINILGLAVAFTCCVLLFLTVRFEFSYDNFHPDRSRLYMVYGLGHQADGDQRSGPMSFAVGPSMKTDVGGLTGAADLLYAGDGIRYKDKEIDKITTLTNEDFFRMFHFPIVTGNKVSPLGALNAVVLNQSTALALFGNEEAVGKPVQVKLGRDWKELTVTAVMADYPQNSTIRPDILARVEVFPGYAQQRDNWNIQHHPVFVELAPGVTQAQAESRMRQMIRRRHVVDDASLQRQHYRKDANGEYYSLRLEPFTDLHFDNELWGDRTVSRPYLYMLILIAVVVMAIACFNFINLNVARSLTRAREVGVRKAIGAGKRQIFFQMWTESLLLCVVAASAGLLATSLLLRPFNQLFTERLELSALAQPVMIAAFLGGILVVSFLAGGYPAWMVARFRAVEVLKGKVSIGRSSLLRNGLITLQFVVASLLICGTIDIYRQFGHLRSAPLGFQQESVISIPVKNGENAARYIAYLRSTLSSQPAIESITGSSINIGVGEDGSMSNHGIGFDYKDKTIMTSVVAVDYDYLKTLGIRPLQGRDFSTGDPADTSSKISNVVLTESVAKEFGEKNVVGLSFYPGDSSSPRWNIIGIIPDIHLYSVLDKVDAITFQLRGKGGLDYIFVRVRTNDPRGTLAMVQAAYRRVEPDNAVNASWLTENTRRWYASEERLSKIFMTAAGIAILLSCLGLFAIVLLVMEQRRKEIGVRKVLGASVNQLTGMLALDFIQLVALAFIVATPVAWYFLDKWLRNFSYRIEVGWWIFPVAGAATLLIALATIGVQTIRAAFANPVDSLRAE